MKFITKVRHFYKQVKEFFAEENHEYNDKDTNYDSFTGPVYNHQMVVIEEERINRILRSKLRKHWLFYSVIFEFEPGNNVYVGMITRWGNVMSVNFTLEDLWFDDYTSSFTIKVDVSSIDTGYFIINSFVHLIGNWFMSFLGTFFNPFSIGKKGSHLRFDKNGIIHFELIPNSSIRDGLPIPKRDNTHLGPQILYNANTTQAALQIDCYSFKDKEKKFQAKDVPTKSSWLRSIDVAALLLLPIGVWVSFSILHHYLPHQQIGEFSWSLYFWISIGILVISFMVMNIPRYIYMYLDDRKNWQSTFIHNNINIQIRRLRRRILTQQQKIRQEGLTNNVDYQEKIRTLLLQIRDKRFLVKQLKLADEDHLRKQKIKFVIAYIGCTLFEWILLMN